MLRAGKTHGEIRDFILSTGEVPPERYAISRHSIKHLKLDSRSAQKKQEADVKDMPVPEMGELLDEALKILFWRMKNRPDDVDTKSLGPFLIQAMRVLEPPKKQANSLETLLGQISDAAANSES